MPKKKQATQATISRSDAERMAALFVSNTRSSGRLDPARGRMHTVYSALSVDDFAAHIGGKYGVGGVPIQDDDSCQWAAIDIDNHGEDEDIPLKPLDEYIRSHNLPLIVCRSKSGGAHVYLFLDKPTPAPRIRAIMAQWAGELGYPKSEVFPKQARLGIGKDGKKQFGNWINLPYFEGDRTNRYAIRPAKLPLSSFLELAEKLRASDTLLRSSMTSAHPEAPPCVQKMYANGVAQGHRNEALYNVVVYLRKANPDGYEGLATDANASIFNKPLSRAEAGRTIASAGRPDYGYRCNEEPIRSLCDRETCLKRKFGITPADAERLNGVDALPNFANLIKYMSEPVRWELEIDSVRVTNVSTPQLLEFRSMRELIADRLTKLVPMIKPSEWERIMAPLMKEARIVETPDDASIAGTIRARLREFASKTDLTNRGKNPDDRKALMRGLPVVQTITVEGVEERCVCFKGQDFVNYLKRTKSEELKGVNLWMAVKDVGVRHVKIRVGDNSINVWTLPVKMVLQEIPEKPTFESEL